MGTHKSPFDYPRSVNPKIIQKECPICMEEKSSPKSFDFFPCTHSVCHDCRIKIRSLQCPVCRCDITSVLSEADCETIKRREESDALERLSGIPDGRRPRRAHRQQQSLPRITRHIHDGQEEQLKGSKEQAHERVMKMNG